MPLYLFECSKGHETEIIGSMADPPKETQRCKTCKRKATRVYTTQKPNVFQEIVTENITGEKVLLKSAAHRDRLLRENGLTMDTVSKPKRKRIEWEKTITFEQVKAKMEGRI